MEHSRRSCRRHIMDSRYAAASDIPGALWLFTDLRTIECGGHASALAYLTGAAIFIGCEANSEIEKAAAEAGHPDVREAGERRSGGEGSSDQ